MAGILGLSLLLALAAFANGAFAARQANVFIHSTANRDQQELKAEAPPSAVKLALQKPVLNKKPLIGILTQPCACADENMTRMGTLSALASSLL